jgi:hypothetical protein
MDWEQILVVALALFTFWDKVRQERYKTRMDREGVKQEKEHTAQESIATQEKDFDLDHRRIGASEEIASQTLEKLAASRKENLEKESENYELNRRLLKLENRMEVLEEALGFTSDNICFVDPCPNREPAKGTYKPNCLRKHHGSK